MTDTTIHQAQRVMAEGGSRWRALPHAAGCAAGSGGNTQSAPTVSTLFPACMTPWMGDGVIFSNWFPHHESSYSTE